MSDNPTTLWLIEPVLAVDDDAWQDRAVWADIVVAAESPAFARLAVERHVLSTPAVQIGNESESRRAGLNDEKLYRVMPLPPERRAAFPDEVQPGEVLSISLLRPPHRP